MFDFSPDKLYYFVLTFPIFLFSLSFHEMMHALTAKWGGDLTSAYQGRITMNPVSHIDPIGTIVMPLLMALSTGIPLLGWAKPVPVVETNYKRGSGYGVIVAMAGPFSNLLLALFAVALYQVFLITIYIMSSNGATMSDGAIDMIKTLLGYAITINLVLMAFNMMPIPPLDGSHVLWHWIIKPRYEWHEMYFAFSRFGFFILIALIGFGGFGVLYRIFVMPIMELMYQGVLLPERFF